MAFPTISDADTTYGTVTSNSSSWTLTYPTNIAAGDLLLAFIAVDGTPGAPSASGFYVQSRGSGANALQSLSKKASGSESGTFSVSVGASEQGSWVVYRIPVGTWHPDSPGQLGNGSDTGLEGNSLDWTTSTSDTPDPPSLNPDNWDAEDTLWLAVVGVDTSRTVTDHSNWDNAGFFGYADYISGGSNGATLAVARLESAAASVDPGTITISNSDDWVAATIAIRPAAASGPSTVSDDFTADSILKKTQSGSLTANAIQLRTRYFGSGPDPR
jgi:hypothetical protein